MAFDVLFCLWQTLWPELYAVVTPNATIIMKMNLLSFRSTLTVTALAIASMATALSLVSCGGGSGGASGTDSTGSSDDALLGAGSSFDYILFSKQFSQYNQANGLKVNYQSVGAGAGISELTNKTVDFDASDAVMNGKQDSAVSSPVLHIPITAGAVAISYNLADIKDTLQLTPGLLADIFLGKITKWNDPKIAAVNKGIKFPATDILI